MKRTNNTKTITIAAAITLALGAASTAKAVDRGCSNSSLNGTYGFTSTGVVVSPPENAGQDTEVGTQTFDGQGGTTATAMLSANGNIIPVSITGTYTVNSDCTGTQTLNIPQFGVTIHVFFVITDNGDAFQGMETEKGFIVPRFARKIFPGRAI